jgi:AraC-like DNA-binding protein
LNPGPDAIVGRYAAPVDLRDAVVHFWVPEWDLPPGQTSRQVVLSYPAFNLVVQPGAPEGSLALYAPRSTVSYRLLSGQGWAVGALLRPAALPALHGAVDGAITSARAMVDSCVSLDQPNLVSGIAAVMATDAPRRQEAAVATLAAWIRARMAAVGAPNHEGMLANALLDLVDALPSADAGSPHRPLPRQVGEAARRLGTSTRTLERVALRHTGLTPAALIRRRRLQDAADRLRRDPTLDLARLAREVGYADHAHLTRDFREVLGFTPSRYRDGVA